MSQLSTLLPLAEAREAASAQEAPSMLPELDGRRVLLATDGSPASDGATRVAWELARAHGAVVELLHVVDTRPAPIPPPLDIVLALTDEEVRARTYDDQLKALRWRASHIVDEPVDWEARILLGTPARTIAREAEAIDAALIVMGLRRYGPHDRVGRDETTLATIRTATRAVLAVAPDAECLPSRVMSAMDFSPASVAAASLACAVMRDHGRLTLAYVPPADGYRPGDDADIIHQMGLAAAFEHTCRPLRSGRCRVDHIVLHHEVRQSIASLLAAHAVSIHAEMIAVGSVSHGRMERWLLGSVSQDLVRDGRHTLLVVPPHYQASHAPAP